MNDFYFFRNDAHGNFSRFRQVRLPMYSLTELDNFQIFGMAKTWVMTGGEKLTLDKLLDGIRHGRAVITDGPFLSVTVSNEQQESAAIGGHILGGSIRIQIESVSNEEFGRIESIRLYLGVINDAENMISDYQPQSFLFDSQVSVSNVNNGYIRAELETAEGHYCYTNPVCIKPDSKS